MSSIYSELQTWPQIEDTVEVYQSMKVPPSFSLQKTDIITRDTGPLFFNNEVHIIS
jgi:hypothetical protein